MEEVVREILRQAVGEASPPRDLAAAIRRRLAPLAASTSRSLPGNPPARCVKLPTRIITRRGVRHGSLSLVPADDTTSALHDAGHGHWATV